jgi:hypothetical protein
MRNRHSSRELAEAATRDLRVADDDLRVPNARGSNPTTPAAVGPADKAPIRTFTARSNPRISPIEPYLSLRSARGDHVCGVWLPRCRRGSNGPVSIFTLLLHTLAGATRSWRGLSPT